MQAAVNSFNEARPDIASAYLADGEGTQVILLAEDEAALEHVWRQASDRDLPCVIYPEAVGIGPATRDEVEGITEGLPLM